jgi:serine O-acetyltransferase
MSLEGRAGSVWATLAADLRVPIERDPASRGMLDVLLSYPGVHAVIAHRFIHALYRTRLPLVPRLLSTWVRFLTGVEIHPGAQLGAGFFIDHGMGVVIGETVEAGRNVTIYQGVTLGGTSLQRGKRHPTLGDNVTVGVGAAVLGAITLGDNVKVGAGSVVVKDVPPNATVVGIPARVVLQDGRPIRLAGAPPHVDMPDPNAEALRRLRERLEYVEGRLADLTRRSGNWDDVAI